MHTNDNKVKKIQNIPQYASHLIISHTFCNLDHVLVKWAAQSQQINLHANKTFL